MKPSFLPSAQSTDSSSSTDGPPNSTRGKPSNSTTRSSSLPTRSSKTLPQLRQLFRFSSMPKTSSLGLSWRSSGTRGWKWTRNREAFYSETANCSDRRTKISAKAKLQAFKTKKPKTWKTSTTTSPTFHLTAKSMSLTPCWTGQSLLGSTPIWLTGTESSTPN